MLRTTDADGLSVAVAALCTPAQAAAALTRAAGVGSLHSGRVREIDNALDILKDLSDETHALIVGLPMPHTERLRSEFLAGRLRDQCRFINVNG